MKIIHSFTMRVLMIMVSLLLLFCAVSTIAWYRSFTQEAVETAEDHMDTVIETLNEMFDEKFIRMWDLYLNACAANFHIGGIDLHQILVTKGVNNEIPLTRWY